MSELFRGWERKVGSILLVMSCLLALAWMRSAYRHDILTLETSDHLSCWMSAYGHFFVKIYDNGDWARPFRPRPGFWNKWTSEDISGIEPQGWHCPLFFEFEPADLDWPMLKHSLIVPYHTIVCPMTLLSAWLLLSKPAKSKSSNAPKVRLLPRIFDLRFLLLASLLCLVGCQQATKPTEGELSEKAFVSFAETFVQNVETGLRLTLIDDRTGSWMDLHDDLNKELLSAPDARHNKTLYNARRHMENAVGMCEVIANFMSSRDSFMELHLPNDANDCTDQINTAIVRLKDSIKGIGDNLKAYAEHEALQNY